MQLKAYFGVIFLIHTAILLQPITATNPVLATTVGNAAPAFGAQKFVHSNVVTQKSTSQGNFPKIISSPGNMGHQKVAFTPLKASMQQSGQPEYNHLINMSNDEFREQLAETLAWSLQKKLEDQNSGMTKTLAWDLEKKLEKHTQMTKTLAWDLDKKQRGMDDNDRKNVAIVVDLLHRLTFRAQLERHIPKAIGLLMSLHWAEQVSKYMIISSDWDRFTQAEMRTYFLALLGLQQREIIEKTGTIGNGDFREVEMLEKMEVLLTRLNNAVQLLDLFKFTISNTPYNTPLIEEVIKLEEPIKTVQEWIELVGRYLVGMDAFQLKRAAGSTGGNFSKDQSKPSNAQIDSKDEKNCTGERCDV